MIRSLFILVTMVLFSSTILDARPLPYSVSHYKKVMNVTVSNKIVTDTLRDLERSTREQLEVMHFVYNAGKNYGLEYTCLSIAYKESHNGEYLFNDVTKDYGIMGINIKTFMQSHDMEDSYWGRKKFASKLIIDKSLNIAIGINNLTGWIKHYKNNWRMIWASYNGGWKPNADYAKHILSIIKAYKIFFKRHPDVSIYVRGN